MHITEKKLIMFFIYLILGIAMAMQFRSTFMINKEQAASDVAFDEYLKQLENEKVKGKELASMVKMYEVEKEKYLKEFANYSDDQGLKTELDDIKMKAALVEVKGAGVTVKLMDAPPEKDINPTSLIIHDIDIVEVVNELKKAGAQAISINGQRLIATSEQVCTGPTVRINKNRYAVPYVITAIGDPEEMSGELEKSQVVLMMREYNLTVDINKSKELTVPGFNNELHYLINGLEVYNSEDEVR